MTNRGCDESWERSGDVRPEQTSEAEVATSRHWAEMATQAMTENFTGLDLV